MDLRQTKNYLISNWVFSYLNWNKIKHTGKIHHKATRIWVVYIILCNWLQKWEKILKPGMNLLYFYSLTKENNMFCSKEQKPLHTPLTKTKNKIVLCTISSVAAERNLWTVSQSFWEFRVIHFDRCFYFIFTTSYTAWSILNPVLRNQLSNPFLDGQVGQILGYFIHFPSTSTYSSDNRAKIWR